jgi:hypothetical protein
MPELDATEEVLKVVAYSLSIDRTLANPIRISFIIDPSIVPIRFTNLVLDTDRI